MREEREKEQENEIENENNVQKRAARLYAFGSGDFENSK